MTNRASYNIWEHHGLSYEMWDISDLCTIASILAHPLNSMSFEGKMYMCKNDRLLKVRISEHEKYFKKINK